MSQPWLDSSFLTSSSDAEIESELEKQYHEMLRSFPSKASRHDKEKLTIHQILEELDETKELIKHFQCHPELETALKDPAGEYTIWAPVNEAFSNSAIKLPDISEASWKDILQHHIAPHALPVRRLLQMGNMPTLLQPHHLNGQQRLRLRPTMTGFQANFNAYIIVSDIIAKNGVIHLVDNILLPPASITNQVELLPPEDFGIAQRTFKETGMTKPLDETIGGTLFLPNNDAFAKLGNEANNFLFRTTEGKPYLQALLLFHFAPAQTLYSNALYKAQESAPAQPRAQPSNPASVGGTGSKESPLDRLRKGTITFPLGSCIEDHKHQVKILRYGSVISVLADQWTPVTTQDCIASNGVVHQVGGILLPGYGMAAVNVKVDALKSMFDGFLQ